MNCGEVGHKLWQCPKREKWKPAAVGSVPAEARGAYHQQHADSVAAQQMAAGSATAAGAGAGAGGASPSGPPADESNAEWQAFKELLPSTGLDSSTSPKEKDASPKSAEDWIAHTKNLVQQHVGPAAVKTQAQLAEEERLRIYAAVQKQQQMQAAAAMYAASSAAATAHYQPAAPPPMPPTMQLPFPYAYPPPAAPAATAPPAAAAPAVAPPPAAPAPAAAAPPPAPPAAGSPPVRAPRPQCPAAYRTLLPGPQQCVCRWRAGRSAARRRAQMAQATREDPGAAAQVAAAP